ncbi:MAG: hypothetical protein JW940_13745 [Polyangiaceae bacterium]|nr:hypothetical protein [Polyangiaceae bacterium]
MPSGPATLSVCLTSVALAPGLPFNLYGFALHQVDDEGHVVMGAVDQEIRYAIVANQPVDLQREIAISFLFQLLGRQLLVGRAASDDKTFADLPAQAAATDEERSKAAGSELRGNWREAVRSLQAQAADAGVSLQVRYEPDPFPGRDEIVRRYGALRRAYNELELAREAIDRAVGALAGMSWKIVGGEDEHMRRVVQEQVESLQLSGFVSQASRDAYVCGDGYLSVGGRETHIRALRPETVEIRAGHFFEHTPQGVHDISDGLVHPQGIAQLRSSYGVSVLELSLHALHTLDTVTDIEQKASRLRRSGLTVQQIRELQEQEELASRVHDDTLARLRTVFAFFLDHLPSPPPALYFPGQELIT